MAMIGTGLGIASNFSPAQLVCIINKERVNYGLNPLGLLPGLNRAAEYHNGFMVKNHNLAIQLPGETNYIDEIIQKTPNLSWQRFGILVGQGFPNEANYVKYMLQDELSRPVILGDFSHYGAAKIDAQDGPWWTQEFTDDGRQHDFPVCPGLSDVPIATPIIEPAPLPSPTPTPSPPSPPAPVATSVPLTPEPVAPNPTATQPAKEPVKTPAPDTTEPSPPPPPPHSRRIHFPPSALHASSFAGSSKNKKVDTMAETTNTHNRWIKRKGHRG
ncbi:hypothetical protein BDF19DRAFT_481164 [Syncephalis fuscata]|nr:hypothetical protein BDF19DRAFT_481164 [Syncephalis fuscata]